MIHHRYAALLLGLTTAALTPLIGCNTTPLGQKVQQQAECAKPKHLDAVGICVDCTINADCAVNQTCNLLTGTCQALPLIPDGGPTLPTCGVGAVRCAIDGHSVQDCDALDGGNGWVDATECVGGQICNPMTLTCAICVPGETVCAPDAGAAAYRTCRPDGTGYALQSCDDVDAGAVGYTCQQVVAPHPSTDGGPPTAGLSACQLCTPNSAECGLSGDGGVGLYLCDSTGTVLEFDACYPTNVCIADGGVPPYCEQYVCLPGQGRCEFDDGGSAAPYTDPARQECNSNGTGWVDSPCQPDPTSGAATVCGTSNGNSGACLTPCQVSESSATYVGCDYWGALLSNSQLLSDFTGNSTDQLPGTTASDFAFVVSNTSTSLTAHVTVEMNNLTPITATVPPGTVQPVYLPWLPICGSGTADFGYHLTSDTPVTVYQFNPLHSSKTVDAYGSNNSSCHEDSDCQNPNCGFVVDNSCYHLCASGQCTSYTYTNDASLLLPTHLLGTSYVVASYNNLSEGSFGNARDSTLAGSFAIVATANNTHLEVNFSATSASTAANQVTQGNPTAQCANVAGNVSAQNAQTTVPFTLSKGQVLQFWSTNVGAPSCSVSLNNNPDDPQQPNDYVCVYPNDFTGTVVTSVAGPSGSGDGGNTNSPAQPIAVFGGADCTYVPYNQVACDHIEEEMFPFNTWGKEYVGVKTATYTGATSVYPDFFRLISACGPTSCPNGATVTFTPEIPLTDSSGNSLVTYSVAGATWCTNSSSTGSTTCTLPPLGSGQTAPWMSFQSGASFFADSDHPVSVVQYLVSESEAGTKTVIDDDGNPTQQSTAVEGDPDILLIPPIEQWRTSYTVLAPNTFLDNYLDMVVNNSALADGGSAIAEVLVDGAPIGTSEWNQIGNTAYYAANHKVCGRTDGASCTGSHTIASSLPVGVTISGYDSYVTYSYTGGLDLQTITTIKPGG